jgi:hypothetical protein
MKMKKPENINQIRSEEYTRIKKGVACVPHDPFYIKNGKEAIHPFIYDRTIRLSDLKRLGRKWIEYVRYNYPMHVSKYQIYLIREIFDIRERKCKTKN